MLTVQEVDAALCATLVRLDGWDAEAWAAPRTAPRGSIPRNGRKQRQIDDATHADRHEAREVCARCPIRLRCLEEGGYGRRVSLVEPGLWGGLDEHERAALG